MTGLLIHHHALPRYKEGRKLDHIPVDGGEIYENAYTRSVNLFHWPSYFDVLIVHLQDAIRIHWSRSVQMERT